MTETYPSYNDIRRAFNWAAVLDGLDWRDGGLVNIAVTLADRHAGQDRRALDWYGRAGARR